MKLQRTATLALVAAAVAAWLAAASTAGHREAVAPPADPAASVDARSESLASEIARLRERLRPTATPHQPGRNLFQFTAKPAAAPIARPPALSESPALPEARPAAPFKLIGMAEDPGPDGPIRTAIISGLGQTFLVKEGQNVTPRYRVARISADVVELADLGDGTPLRLVLK